MTELEEIQIDDEIREQFNFIAIQKDRLMESRRRDNKCFTSILVLYSLFWTAMVLISLFFVNRSQAIIILIAYISLLIIGLLNWGLIFCFAHWKYNQMMELLEKK